MNDISRPNPSSPTILVLGATGKTGRRVVERLRARGAQVRLGSRSAQPAFDWDQESTWSPALEGVDAVYVTYAPDLAIPGATDAIGAFVQLAKQREVQRLVLLSGRGEEEAQACERIVQAGG
ncbi:MAG: NAD(P)H-binding protein, partial [Myxococcota bacterium]